MAMKAKWDEKIDYGNPDAVKKHFLDFLAASPYNAEREAYLERFGQGYDNVYTGLMILILLKARIPTKTCISTSCRLADAPMSSIRL